MKKLKTLKSFESFTEKDKKSEFLDLFIDLLEAK